MIFVKLKDHFVKKKSQFVLNSSVNNIVSFNTSPTPTWSQLGSEKLIKKMNITINLLALIQNCSSVEGELVLVRFCELLIYRSSSTMFKLQLLVGLNK